MSSLQSELRIKGKSITVASTRVEGREVVCLGRWPRMATLNDEEWLEGVRVADPVRFVNELKSSALRADIFTFPGTPGSSPVVANGWVIETDNAAVIPTSDFKSWWEGLPQEARKNTRRAGKKGIELRSVSMDDALARGIKAIYDETPTRQGRPFWHYGKDVQTVKRENSTYLDRSEFLGAYLAGELVGFMKWVYVNDTARIMQILAMNAHQDKRPIIALIAKAAEICHARGMRYLIYGKYTYGRKTDSSIAEFKRRLGFTQQDFARYYVPLTWRGSLALRLGLHHGVAGLLPASALAKLLQLRGWWLNRATAQATHSVAVAAEDDKDAPAEPALSAAKRAGAASMK